MSEEQSPYEVSKSGMSPAVSPDLPPALPSPVPKVFGIIHICYAVLGGVGAFFGLIAMFAMKMLAEKGGEEFKEIQPIVEAYSGMASYMYVDVALKLLLGVLLLVAGIGLLKRKAWAIKLSVVWAVSRMIIAAGMLFWGLSVAAEFQDSLGGASGEQQVKIEQMTQSVGNVMGIIMISVYPVVSLIFLTKKNVRDAMH